MLGGSRLTSLVKPNLNLRLIPNPPPSSEQTEREEDSSWVEVGGADRLLGGGELRRRERKGGTFNFPLCHPSSTSHSHPSPSHLSQFLCFLEHPSPPDFPFSHSLTEGRCRHSRR